MGPFWDRKSDSFQNLRLHCGGLVLADVGGYAMRNRVGVWIVFALALGMPAGAAAAPSYHLLHTWKLGGEGGWDYLKIDADARRLYISRGTKVVVIDADSGKPVGQIADTLGVHGIALAPEFGKGFTSNG